MNDFEKIKEYRQTLKEYSFGKLIDELIQLRIKSEDVEGSVTEKSKNDLKIREIRREINERFLKTGSGSSNNKGERGPEGVSKISDLISFN